MHVLAAPVNNTSGLVTCTTAPATGVQVTAPYDTDVRARVDSDQLKVTDLANQFGSGRQIPVAFATGDGSAAATEGGVVLDKPYRQYSL